VLALLIFLLIREHPDGQSTQTHQVTSGSALWQGFLEVIRNRQTWINGLFVGLLFAPTSAFGELWGVSYFVGTYHLSQSTAANAVGFIFIGWAVGGPIAGWFSDDLKRRKIVMMLSAVASLLTLGVALYLPLPFFGLCTMLFLYGIANAGVGVSYALSSEINHKAVAGISMAFANMASVVLGAFCQPLIGWLLEKQWNHLQVNHVPVYSVHAYQMAMLPLLLMVALAIVVVFFVKETYCTALENRA
jgi:MFS family permease